MRGYVSAMLNILEDSAAEKQWLASTQSAVINILADAADEAARLADTQRAAMNILEDFDLEKAKVQELNAELDERVRQRTAELEAANKELDSFAYSVSHDLRAPLRAIDGFSQILEEDYGQQLGAEAHGHIQRIVAGTRTMGRLIDDLLRLSRVTRGEFHREPVDLSALAWDVVGRIRQAEPGRKVDVEVAAGMTDVGDRDLLRIALENLLGNAFKFTARTAGARIEFGCERTRQAATYYVRDNGAGFDPAYAAKLFGPFQRLHTEKEFAGTGIGLATVQRIVHRHGGRVSAEAAVDQGATFRFTLHGGRSP